MPADEAVDLSRATLSRIASAADVSISTVSKVLNGRTGVSEATRAKVEAQLHQHGYQRRGLRDSAPLIELVFVRFTTVWALEILRGVQAAARSRGVGVVVTESGDYSGPGPEWIDAVMQRNPIGVVLVMSGVSQSQLRQLRARGIPVVVVDPAGDPAPGVASVGSANWNGGLIATRHLLGLGHRKIAVIGGPEQMMCSRARLAGYRSALDEAGVPVRSDYILAGDFERDSGLELGKKLLSLPERPTAIFSCNDLMALGVYEAARQAGLSIPDDLSVVGYDDLSVAEWAGPPLTTVRQPLLEMGRQASTMLLDLDLDAQAPRVDLATDLVVRASADRPPRS
ncbi:transcriptional regulator [Microlunatus endophyticus]|uniref:Transcriptional regulator n=1 Tax=Microlunatus endophyticus TaxID=1716077 RepID=A0A917SB20_9ACTN|nr:LacI family DNA-binding transcriptional regulator [Microlunatus endophyticus]GGL65700.1 transcriptional regulator [Microlunatus endophyticus]